MDYDMSDAWSGTINPLDESFKIRFSDGIIQSVFENNSKNIKWQKKLNIGDNDINYAFVDHGNTKRVIAKIKSANFAAQIESESEIEKFLEIIKNYRSGRCEDCLDSRSTKRILQILKKRELEKNK
jgi:DNA-binding MltR family transcriptional regulator